MTCHIHTVTHSYLTLITVSPMWGHWSGCDRSSPLATGLLGNLAVGLPLGSWSPFTICSKVLADGQARCGHCERRGQKNYQQNGDIPLSAQSYCFVETFIYTPGPLDSRQPHADVCQTADSQRLVTRPTNYPGDVFPAGLRGNNPLTILVFEHDIGQMLITSAPRTPIKTNDTTTANETVSDRKPHVHSKNKPKGILGSKYT